MRTALRRPAPPATAPWVRGWLPLQPAAPWALAAAAAPASVIGNAIGNGTHPLAEPALSASLRQRADEIDAAFARIEPLLQAWAGRQFDTGFAAAAAAELADAFGLDLSPTALQASWNRPLALGALHARCVIGTFCRLVEREFDRNLARLHEGESAEALIRRFGFHAIDITPCADGRLAGVVDYVLRVPPAVVAYRKSYAGAMFDVEESLRHWEAVELRRWREGRPNPAADPSRFLKIGVYHFSSADPAHEGCAAHGSDDDRAAGALLERLQQFEQAVQATHGERAATLLVGVDTDTDAIRVHVPDAAGRTSTARYVCNLQMYAQTAALAREDAKQAIRAAVADCAGTAADDTATEGLRWLCGYLLKNNLGQVDAVQRQHGGLYADRGHTERLIVVGDAVDDVQLRNLAFQAQMATVEEGAGDLDVGLRILGHRHEPLGLAVPVLVHMGYDERVAGAQQRAEQRTRRLRAAIEARYAGAVARAELLVHGVVRAHGSARMQAVAPAEAGRSGCACTHSESRA
jgi:carboxysome shell carbonic anhydrase